MLCVNGDVLDNVLAFDNSGKVVENVHIFSRTSPNQKALIVNQLNREGHGTLMCGDGTNDVGSLK